jgi:hypothetical protein
VLLGAGGNGWTMTADGQRFPLVSQEQETANLHTVVLNWTADVKK